MDRLGERAAATAWFNPPLRLPLAIAFVTVLVASLLVQSASVSQPGNVTVQLLAFNDFHGHIEPPSGSNGEINGTPAGGAEYLATFLADAVARNPDSLVVAAGDVIGAAPLVSSLFHNEPAIEAVNAMHLAVSSVGNHEFDGGVRELLRMQLGGCHPTDGCADGDPFDGAGFTYLSANVLRAGT